MQQQFSYESRIFLWDRFLVRGIRRILYILSELKKWTDSVKWAMKKTQKKIGSD